jgi:hypothetical protein
MDYPKLAELVPTEKLGPLSDQLLNFVLTTKNDGKMPTKLANCMLSALQQGIIKNRTGVSVLLEAALLLEPEKTMNALVEMQMTQLSEEIKKGGM